jgi:CDP-diacylglycerol--serine O-phosphatidyltransferase
VVHAEVGPLGFVPCLLFAVCSSLRLARFNASLDIGPGKPKPAYAYNFFTGVPAPAGAGCALFPLFAALALGEWGWTASRRRSATRAGRRPCWWWWAG